MLPCRFRYTLLRRVSVRDTMKKRRLKNKVYRLPVTEELKNKKPVDNIEYVKRIRAAIDETLKPVEKIKYVPADFRDPVFHLTVWAWIKQKVFNPIGHYIDSKFKLGVKEFVKQAAKSFTVYMVIFLIIICIILTVKYLL